MAYGSMNLADRELASEGGLDMAATVKHVTHQLYFSLLYSSSPWTF